MVVIKKLILFALILLLVNPFTYAAVTPYGYGGSSGNLDVSRPDDNEPETRRFFTRISDEIYSLRNKQPVTTLNYPADGRVVSGNLIEFGWSYSDDENDEQLNYQLEIDDDPRFYSSLSYYGFTENKRRVYISEGDKSYYWRVKSRDNFGWGDFSQVESFYLDLSRKACKDGTLYFQCSTSFNYCDTGELVEDCNLCGCPLNSECSASGACLERTCFDGTRHGLCSTKKPSFCQNGELKEVCSLCGCPDGQECNLNGECSKVVVEIKSPEARERAVNGFFRFLRSIFLNN